MISEKSLELVRKIGTSRRAVVADESGVEVRLYGLTTIAALKSHLNISYADIASVSVGPIESISIFAPRIGYSNPLTGARGGRFRTKGEHMFVSFDRPSHQLLTIFLVDKNSTGFDKIVVEIERPGELKLSIEKKAAANG